jgi:hypothetical protein
MSDIHMVLGPAYDEMSNDTDFSDDAKGCFYDIDDQITNIVMMHELVNELRKPEEKKKSEEKKEEKERRKARRAKLRQEIL